jgi:phosphoribosyl 1,2-cyclic phosphodiesterase
VKVTVLASGSSGNVSVFESGGECVLVDAGLAPRTLVQRLREAGVRSRPVALVVTHAHRDHLGHAEAVGRSLGVPVYLTESTARMARLQGASGVRLYAPRVAFGVGGFTVTPTPLPHDVAQVALCISDGARAAAIATDLGEVPAALPDAIARCEVLLIESNHDPDMLRHGPYPKYIKKRVASARGHLSNLQTHALLRALAPATHSVALMHLSRTNNAPEIALSVAADALAGRRVRLAAASHDGTLVLDAAAGPPDAPLRREDFTAPRPALLAGRSAQLTLF